MKINKKIDKIDETNKTIEISETLLQFIKFGIVGISNTAISYITYLILLLLFNNCLFFDKDIRPLVSQFFSFLISIIWCYYWNQKCVFNDNSDNVDNKKDNIKEKIKYHFPRFFKMLIFYSLTNLLLSEALLFLEIKCFGISSYIAPIINLTITVPLNFFLNKFLVFSKKRKK